MHLTEEQRCLLWLSAAKITPAHATMLAEAYGGVQGVWDAYGSHGGPEFPSQARKALSPLHSRAAMDSLIARLEQKNVRLLFPGRRALSQPAAPSLTARLICCTMQVRSTVWKGPWSRWWGRGSPAPMEEKWHACSPAVFARRACAWSAAWPAALIWRCMRARWRREAIPSACWAAASTCPIRLNTGPSCGKSQEEIGLILSEYPLDAQPLPYHFPHRNRIISGLSLGVVFVEGRIKSGGMHHRGRCAFAGTRGVRSSRLRGYNRRGRPASYSPGGWAHRYQRRRHFGGSGPWPQTRRTRTG